MDEVVAKLFQIYETTPVLVSAYDGFDRLRYANPAFRSAFFVELGEEPLWSELMRRNFLLGRGTVIRNPDFEAWLFSTQARRGKAGFRAFETDVVDGRWFWMTETVQADGWMLCIASDVTELKAEDRAVRQDRDFAIKTAHTDDLTGAANRRYVMARIDDMLDRPAEPRTVLGCVAILDLDNFKVINDRFGHLTGDLVLTDFARRIQQQIRRTDCFGRVGGEEFMLVLPNTSIEQANLIAERMLAVVRASMPFPERPDFRYSFSAGIAAGLESDTVSSLYARADSALYLAKVAGRNRIHIAELPPSQAAIA
ncbi:GGDEF domain-containing protein [Kaistia dalseonensis]|uniref:diguanylate cyclase n=1 Tax=Kaistia dalseonensis TaxID=410840 RepID=A0ABU0H1M0_9HYPH|nr:GGDEF domain-containing protein [Kaistia dalseonensis]MCX5493647.1 GGDEF domain-containing protein [Kaistia dalseonensis]MDQ0436209.1 diguanylate cyclase (GGDEF)-like protein [Kaistia dalseonensis]